MDRSGENIQISDFLWPFYCVLSFVPSILKQQLDSSHAKHDASLIYEKAYKLMDHIYLLFDRPGVAGAVLQSAL